MSVCSRLQMPVQLHGELDLRMPHLFANVGNGYATREEQGSELVAGRKERFGNVRCVEAEQKEIERVSAEGHKSDAARLGR